MTADNVIRLATSKEKVVRACATCRYRYKEYSSYRCSAVELYCSIARMDACSEGEMWEPKVLPTPMKERILTWWRGPVPR